MRPVKRVRLPQTAAQFCETPTGTAVLVLATLTRLFTWCSRERTAAMRRLLEEHEADARGR